MSIEMSEHHLTVQKQTNEMCQHPVWGQLGSPAQYLSLAS